MHVCLWVAFMCTSCCGCKRVYVLYTYRCAYLYILQAYLYCKILYMYMCALCIVHVYVCVYKNIYMMGLQNVYVKYKKTRYRFQNCFKLHILLQNKFTF